MQSVRNYYSFCKLFHMKTLGVIISLSLLFYSCREISFPEAQPAGVPALKEVPAALQGRYRGLDDKGNDTDTLIVESWGYHFKDGRDNDWLGRGVLSDSLVLKYFENFYFVNFRSGKHWVVRLIKVKSSGTIQFMSINIGDEGKRKSVLKKLSKRFKVLEINEKGDLFFEISPTKEQLMLLVKEGYFSGDDLEKIR